MDAIQPIHPRRNVLPNDTRSQSERVLAEVGPTLELLARVHGWPPPADLIELWCDQLRRAGERLEELQLPVHVAALCDFQVDPAGQLYWGCLPQRIEETRRSLAGESASQQESDDFFSGRLWAHSTLQLIDKLQSQLRQVDIGKAACTANPVARCQTPSLSVSLEATTDSRQRPVVSTESPVRRHSEKERRVHWWRASRVVTGVLGCAVAGLLASLLWDSSSLEDGGSLGDRAGYPPVREAPADGEPVASTEKELEIAAELETVSGHETAFDLGAEFDTEAEMESFRVESLLGPAGDFDAVIASVEPLPANDAADSDFQDMTFPSANPSELASLPQAEDVREDGSQGEPREIEKDSVDFRMQLQRPRFRQQLVHNFPSTTKPADLRLEIVQANQETPLLIDWPVPMQPIAARRARGTIEIRLAPGDPLALRVQMEMTLQRSLTVETVAVVSQFVPTGEAGWTLAGGEQTNAAVAGMDMWLERYPAVLATVREQISNTSNGELRSRLRWQRDSLESQAERVKELREQFARLQQLFTRCEQELLLQIRSGLH
jgi:hypothetical protein